MQAEDSTGAPNVRASEGQGSDLPATPKRRRPDNSIRVSRPGEPDQLVDAWHYHRQKKQQRKQPKGPAR